MDLKIYLAIIAALATAVAAGAAAYLAAPFASPLAWALIIGIATMPHYRRLHAATGRRPLLSATAMTLLIILGLILPLAGLFFLIEENAADWLKESQQLFNSLTALKGGTFLKKMPFAKPVISLGARVGIDITGHVAKLAAGISHYLLEAVTSALKNLAALLFALALMLFILFFVYRDGDAVVTAAMRRCSGHRERVLFYLSEISSTTSAVVVGTLFTCLVQGGLAGVGYYVAGTPLAVLCGVLTAAAGLLPVVGSAVIWIPLVAYLGLRREYLHALLLFLWCLIVVVAITDNVIRPLAVGAKGGKIPALAVVLGAVGGVMTMGVLGLLAGPIVFVLLVVVWRDFTGTAPGEEPPPPPASLDDVSL
ncbi:AI-2E family transporter [Geomonas sp. RF6]|uniref:AI-2E family transporter n=1 Tax=Geomonas sp. RF6 TaxID=2897342 RepID=UPI001E2BCC10|nr:AI-2E family transporter [Geomonas sp. RF6]UFS71736.1 AI-2E family transporter [Geomonas sp. RF6]